jgi:chemotaxis protein MotA
MLWQNKGTMSKATLFGLLIGFGAIFLGNLIEGGHVDSLLQGTAFLIVLGGTLGAVLVSNPQRDLSLAFQLFRSAFNEDSDDESVENIRDIVECSKVAKKDGLIELEKRIKGFNDPFFKRVLRNVIDGIDPQIIRETFEVEIISEEERLNSAAKVWADAGGFSPTIGIIGAVLGLIHVMGNLTDTSKLGGGIAVAFVATVYGVGFANLVFLPIAAKLKKKIQHRIRTRYLVLEGALLIPQGLSTAIVDQKLRAYLEQDYQKDI